MNKKKGAVFAEKLIKEYKKGSLGSEIHRKWKFPCNFKTKKQRLTYLFFLLNIDYGMRAEKLFEKVKNLAENEPKWFDGNFLKKQSISKIEKLMKEKVEHRFPKQAALRWKKNANVNVITLFKGNTNEILEKIEEFYGFGPKLSRLLLRSVVDLKVINQPKGFEKMSLPTDVHVINLGERSGLFNKKPKAEEAREAWTEVAFEKNIVPVDLDRALWSLGADFCFNKKCLDCPMGKICVKPVKKERF